MTGKPLRYLEAVAQTGAISAAARQLFVSPPSLSQFVKRLEEDNGIVIFDRSGGPWKLTLEGKYFLDCERRIEAILRERHQYFEDLKTGLSGELRVGSTQYRSETLLSRILPVFAERYPGIRVRITELTTQELVSAAGNGEVDCAFVISRMMTKELVGVEVYQENVLLAVPRKLAARGGMKVPGPGRPPFPRISFSKVADLPFIIMKSGQAFREYFEILCARYGVKPAVALETQSILTVPALVSAGLGAALVPDTLCPELGEKEVEFFSLGGDLPVNTLSLVRRRGKYVPRACQLFFETAYTVLKGSGGLRSADF
ncbi:MAG: LysR family transcriptional regulator [Mesosutterella sp.]|uniref:LysR family transcriptional regulator n=1 Tax=Mesosutterella faecium TaxID=2925194 RepID=A0ABT7IJC0_9BURK|nr:LysR family transcriptional regulator [Mesosutterella sp. AGMB02718]MCI6530255.1 LysR family transcriptional regulator [Mesosutterella sp.]MDL2058468.1 LysR family transcriptional regulator [Mesosutterella sp. AGMB02718]